VRKKASLSASVSLDSGLIETPEPPAVAARLSGLVTGALFDAVVSTRVRFWALS
jgi:hypothetical protein